MTENEYTELFNQLDINISNNDINNIQNLIEKLNFELTKDSLELLNNKYNYLTDNGYKYFIDNYKAAQSSLRKYLWLIQYNSILNGLNNNLITRQ